jgi:hypothetical protein
MKQTLTTILALAGSFHLSLDADHIVVFIETHEAAFIGLLHQVIILALEVL